MNTFIYRFSFGTVVCFSLSLTASAFATGALVLQKVPALTVERAPAYPENVARQQSGATIQIAGQNLPANSRPASVSGEPSVAEGALLSGDPTTGYALSNGTTTFIVSLSKIENIDTVSCINRGAKGDMMVSISNTKLPINSPQWRQVAKNDLVANAVNTKIGPSEAKYVKLTFNVIAPGHISSLGVYSTSSVAAFTMPRTRRALDNSSFGLVTYNMTDIHARARALYVSSGDDLKQANNMIDDQPATNYAFAGNDATPTAIIDLGKPTNLRRISAIYSARPGKIDFFVLQSLPGTTASKTLRVDEHAFTKMLPVGSVVNNDGRAAIDFPQTSGRYIVLKWTPASTEETAFSVAEVAAFGANKQGDLLAANSVAAADDRDEGDGKTVQDGKDAKDAKDIPAEGPESPAEGPPPGLPDPPPFTFVPEIVPTSP